MTIEQTSMFEDVEQSVHADRDALLVRLATRFYGEPSEAVELARQTAEVLRSLPGCEAPNLRPVMVVMHRIVLQRIKSSA